MRCKKFTYGQEWIEFREEADESVSYRTREAGWCPLPWTWDRVRIWARENQHYKPFVYVKKDPPKTEVEWLDRVQANFKE